MKTKVIVELYPKSEKQISAEVVLEKKKHDESSGTLKYTRLVLKYEDRITLSELDTIATERKDYKIKFGKEQSIVCPAEAITGISPKGKRYYYLKVQLSDRVSRNFFFDPNQRVNIEEYGVKYHFDFTEKENDEIISMLDLVDKKDLEEE